MGKRKQKAGALVCRVIAKRRRLTGDDDPLFDDREIEFCGYSDGELKPPEK
jgi:hypothetical protein